MQMKRGVAKSSYVTSSANRFGSVKTDNTDRLI